MRRSSEKRSWMPPLMMSFRWITPSRRPSLQTPNGVPPDLAISSDFAVSSRTAASDTVERTATPPPLPPSLPACRAKASTASTAPLRMAEPPRSTPDSRVCAVNAMKCASTGAISRPRMLYFSFARTTIERPSGVSSDSEANCAASASSCAVTPASGRNSVAWRLPSVMVPVLSSSSVSTSPAASTARPDIASTLKRTSRSMPAMPIADSSAPIVVGISATNSATRITTDTVPPA